LGWNFDAPHNSKNYMGQFAKPVLTERNAFDYMIGQTARLKKEVLTIEKQETQ
jgi:hypothetical protein